MFWLITIPLIGSLITFFVKNKWVAFSISLIPFILLALGFSHQEFNFSWFPALEINFNLKTDPLSLVFLFLTALIIPITIIVGKPSYHALILLLQSFLIGFFSSRDLVFFTIFWEAMLLPLYFLINLGNKPEKKFASLQFLLYMFAGSILMVASLIALFSIHGTFDFEKLFINAENTPYAALIFGAFVLAFAVKTPLFPFHAWLADAYDQSPTSGTILLSALLSKAGIYGFLRIGLQMFPKTLETYSYPLLVLAISGALYGALAAYRENNFKRIIAYSSFSHVNFILAGIFVASKAANEGSVLQAFNHGIIITGLFLVSGWLEMRLNSTSLFSAGGLAKLFPRLTWLTFIFILASIALPGTNGFIGELLILFGVFGKSKTMGAILTLSVIFSAAYMLRYLQTIYFQELTREPLTKKDIDLKNVLIALPLIFLIFWIGLYPSPLLDFIAKEPL